MARKTISLDEEAYERLTAEKREGESFSDVVRRLTGERSWREVAGVWADDTDDIEAAFEAGRDRSRDRRDQALTDDPLLSAPAVSADDPVPEDGIGDAEDE